LRDYEIFGGFDFKKCRIQDYTLKVNTPPNPSNWEEQFISTPREVLCKWDPTLFKSCNFKNPELLTLGVLSSSGTELYRKDFRDKTFLNLETTEYNAKFASIDKPKKILMYLKDEDGSWSPAYQKEL
jgi:hypothetical protein